MSGAMGSREMMTAHCWTGRNGASSLLRPAATPTRDDVSFNPKLLGKYELVAISASNGLTKWEGRNHGRHGVGVGVGQGRQDLLATASDFVMNGQNQSGGGMMNPGTSTTSARKSRLIIVTAIRASASISNTIELDSDVLSAPKVTDDATNYTVYVTGFEMGAEDKSRRRQRPEDPCMHSLRPRPPSSASRSINRKPDLQSGHPLSTSLNCHEAGLIASPVTSPQVPPAISTAGHSCTPVARESPESNGKTLTRPGDWIAWRKSRGANEPRM